MTAGSAHGASLPIFAAMQRLEGTPAWNASEQITEMLGVLDLDEDIDVVILINQADTSISLEPASDAGQRVLDELGARAHFLPCPAGECEFVSGSPMCKWCGTQKK